MTSRILAISVGVLLLTPGAAEAHGLVQRQQLPIPQWLFFWAAAAVLVVSFFALALLWPKPKLEQEHWRPLPGGAYEVIVVSGTARRHVTVRTGLFDESSGLVEVTGAGLAAGQRVEVPDDGS